MKKLLLLALCLCPAAHAAENNASYLCRVVETKGRQTETYDFRLVGPNSESVFNLRIFTKVEVQADLRWDTDGYYFTLNVLDTEMPGAINNGDMNIGGAHGYNFVGLRNKIGYVKDHGVQIDCLEE